MTTDATRQMIAELRRMSNRTGNKQAEKTMRDAASWMEDLNTEFLKAANEVDKLRQRLADKDEQLAGWKALVDRIQGGTETKSVADERNPKLEKNKRYDYTAVLTRFVQGDDEILRIPTKNADRTGRYDERKAAIRHPSFYTMRDTIARTKSPVSAFYDDATCEIVLVKQGGRS